MLICLHSLAAGLAMAPAMFGPSRASEPGRAAEPAASAPLRSTVKASPASGKLVRSIVVTRPAATPAAAPPEITRLVESTAAAHAVDPLLVESVMKVESNFQPDAVSPKGALGLMQLMPATAKRFGAADAFDARQNIEAGVKYLKFLKETFQDDRLALAAYNAGEGAVLRHRGVPPYKETREYVEKVGQRYSQALSRRKTAVPVPAATPAEPPLRSVEMITDEEGRVHLRTRD